MSDFYRELSKYIGEIFPASSNKMDFLLHASRFGNRLLDVACGDGTIAKALKDQGKEMVAIDIEKSMVDLARKKGLEAYQMDMLEMKFNKRFDFIYCIGNSLSHLNNMSQVDEFLFQLPALMYEKSIFLIQIINYTNIWDEKAEEGAFLGRLPTIKTEKLIFERKYYKAGDKLRFHTVLSVDGKVYENDEYLIPILPEDLINYIISIGFQVKIYGGFNKKNEFNDEKSMFFILKAYR